MKTFYSDSVEVPVFDALAPVSKPSISWTAIAFGTLAGVAIQVGLLQLVAGAGLSLYEPTTSATPVASLAVGGAVALVITAVIALFAGGWVAGRVCRTIARADTALHGLLVWATWGVLALVAVGSAVGFVAAGGTYMAGQGVQAVATGAAAVVPAAAEIAAPTWDAIRGDLERGMAAFEGSGQQDERFRERSRLIELLGSSFAADTPVDQKERDRSELVTLLAARTGISEEAAARTYTQWQQQWQRARERYETAKREAEASARQKAEELAAASSGLAFAAFASTLAGLAAALLGALCGRATLLRRNQRFASDEQLDVVRTEITRVGR